MKWKERVEWAVLIAKLVSAIIWVLIAISLFNAVTTGEIMKGITYAPMEHGEIIVVNYDSVVVASGEMFIAVNESANTTELNMARAEAARIKAEAGLDA